MKSNKIFFLLSFISCIFLHAEERSEQIDIDKYQNIISTILTNLSTIIDNNQISKNVYETFALSENSIRSNDVTFKIDPELDNILNGMAFRIYETGEISLVFGQKYLDTYSLNSSIHYSILIHEYRHLHDYLKNSTVFLDAKKDEKESYWYELDALRIEAEFIKYYLAGKYNLSKFEEYLLYSFENNNLNSASILLQKESMNIFFYFNDLETRYFENKDSKEDIINELEQNGTILIKNFYENNDDFTKFYHYIEISTFRKYLVNILITLINKPKMTWGEVFTQYPKIEDIYSKMNEILNIYNDDQSQYWNSVYQYWEDDIINIPK
jgi:hypothetical protein